MPTLKARYYLPTPVFWRKIGDACLTVSTTITVIAALNKYPWTSALSSILGLAGKLITNFFTDIKEEPDEETPVSPKAD